MANVNRNIYDVYSAECFYHSQRVITDLQRILDYDTTTAKDIVYEMKHSGHKQMLLSDREVELLKNANFDVKVDNRFNITIDDDIF